MAELNENSKDLTLILNKSDLKNGDVITVRYGSDHPCVDCYYKLTILADVKKKLPAAETNEHFGKLSIPMNELLEIKKADGIDTFQFNYSERSKKLGIITRNLFVLKIM